MVRVALLTAAALMLTAPELDAATSYVLGDSIGDGVATTLHLNNLAQIGIHIRGPKALAQISRTPPGSTVFIFLGTNDAEGSIKNIDKGVDDIISAADRKNLNVIWLGPHCVRKSWDVHARELDDILRTHFAGTRVKYISMRDPQLCTGSFHEPDGVHLTMKGYRYMWAKVQSVVDGSATALAAATPPSGAASSSVADATGSVVPKLASAPARNPGDGGHRLVMEYHVPGSPSEPLVWVRSLN
jgi:hypothetical protein